MECRFVHAHSTRIPDLQTEFLEVHGRDADNLEVNSQIEQPDEADIAELVHLLRKDFGQPSLNKNVNSPRTNCHQTKRQADTTNPKT